MKKIILCFTFSLGILACNSSKIASKDLSEKHIQILFQSEYGGSGTDEIQLITQKEAFTELWEEITGQPKEEIQAFNDQEEMVIVKHFTSGRSGGATYTVNKIKEKKGHIQVYYSVQGPGAIGTDAITSPVLMVKVNKQDKPTIEFILQQ